MAATDELLQNHRRYAHEFRQGDLPAAPQRPVAIVACMDARLDVYRMFGLGLGEAHVIRNAGGVVTEDVIRSLLLSQRKLGTREIMLIHHTDCGMAGLREAEVKSEIERETGLRPPFALDAFADPEADVRQSLRRLEASPFIAEETVLRGFVYAVEKGVVREVTRDEESTNCGWQRNRSR